MEAEQVTVREASFPVGGSLVLRADRLGPESGTPVLLLHGGGQTRWSWGRTAEVLAGKGVPVFSLDMRGHGQSDWSPGGEYALDHFAQDLRSVVAQIGTAPIIVGASLGGLAALLACGEAPRASCAGLVLVDISPRIEGAGSDRVTSFLRSTVGGFDSLEQAVEAVAAYAPQRKREPRPEGLLKNMRRDDDGRYRWHWDPAFVLPKDDAPEWDGAALESRLMEAARAIEAPTLIVRGSESDVISDETLRHLREALPHVDQALIPGTGHMIAGDDNAAFNAAILPFVLDRAGVRPHYRTPDPNG